MKIGIYSLTFALLLATIHGYTQTPLVTQLKLPQIAPASPDAAAMGRFGNFPVTYSTGVPGISIPLWTIKCGSISWPISLSYHASGIKVDQAASIVGLGWNLDGPAVISRIVNGRADEETGVAEPTDLGNVTDNDFVYLYNVEKGLADAELDLFNFSFNGRSGKFMITHEGTATILQVPHSDLKINHDAALNYFTITDETGIVYTFDQKESTQTVGANTTVTYTSSWYLTKVELPDKNNIIQFTYAFAGDNTDTYFTYMQTIGQKWVPNLSGDEPILQPINDPVSSSSSGVKVSMLKLTGITFPNGSVVLNYDALPREDLGGSTVYSRLKSIVFNEVVNTLTTPKKTFLFNQSYFNYQPTGWTASPTQSRLRLDNLIETGILTGPNIKQHTFQYNTTNLSPRMSNGQDMWGYNNGLTGNPSLIQTENVSYFDGGTTINATVGDADRSVNAALMEGWMLTSITYPTGGKTTFDFEPHVYATDFTYATNKLFGASVIGNQTPPLQNISPTFTYPNVNVLPGTTRLIVDMSKINFAGVTQPSVVVLRNVTLSQDVFVLSQPRQNERYSYDQPITLQGGHQYELKATLYTNGSMSPADAAKLDAAIRIVWSQSSTAPDIRTGGGLRIKEMLHYTDATTIVGKETFVYDTAVTLTPFSLINKRYKDQIIRLGIASGNACLYNLSNICRIYNSQSVYAISNALGSPMLYRRVEKIIVNPANGAPNGKSVFVYDVFQDPNIPVGGPLALGAQWANGFLKSEMHYKYNGSTYVMIQKKENEYNTYNATNTVSLRVEPKVITEGCTKADAIATVFEDLRYYTIDIPTGSKRLAKAIITDIDEFQNNLVTTTTNYYTNLAYSSPTAVVVVDSKNERDSVTYKYSPDYATGVNNVYDKMKAINLLQPVIEQISYNNTTKLNTVRNHYKDWFSNSKVIDLDTVQSSLYNNPLETRLKYYWFDIYGNTVSAGKTLDAWSSYFYGYNSQLPVAEIPNASSFHAAYTSFETDEKNGWTGTFGAGLGNFGSITGKRAWTKNNFSFSKSGLSATLHYMVSYWSKNGAYAVNATAAVAGRTFNGWTNYSHKIVNPSGGIITVTGSGSIDELRLYPAIMTIGYNTQMTTYTYSPNVGVTSKCDANNRITYYEYDELQRLVLIRDHDRNIVKKFAYNYHGKTEYPSIYYNTAQTTFALKQGCTGCQIGSLVGYTVPAGVYLSTSGQTEANALATAEANAYAQSYANATGTCAAPGASVMTANNQITNNGFSIKFQNNCTATIYTYSIGLNTTITISPAIPVGNYTVTITKMNGAGTYTYKVNSLLQTTPSNPVFPNVDVLATGNQGVIIQPNP